MQVKGGAGAPLEQAQAALPKLTEPGTDTYWAITSSKGHLSARAARDGESHETDARVGKWVRWKNSQAGKKAETVYDQQGTGSERATHTNTRGGGGDLFSLLREQAGRSRYRDCFATGRLSADP